MNEGREFDLLIDVSKLLRKYGPDVFDQLAEQLSAPEFVERLTKLLSGAARTARAVPATQPRLRPKSPSQKEIRSSLVALGDTDPERGALLVRLYDELMAKTVLPTMEDLRSFAARVGLCYLEIRSRPQAVVALLGDLRGRPLEELRALVADLNTAAEQHDRSLENWTRIILDKELRTRKAQ
ncbi:MAG TPA: hypothetical protein VEL76_03485 [Gemmataceae bacterium]|nr:hypothetical protein [Gemmataceae bacterium]